MIMTKKEHNVVSCRTYYGKEYFTKHHTLFAGLDNYKRLYMELVGMVPEVDVRLAVDKVAAAGYIELV